MAECTDWVTMLCWLRKRASSSASPVSTEAHSSSTTRMIEVDRASAWSERPPQARLGLAVADAQRDVPDLDVIARPELDRIANLGAVDAGAVAAAKVADPGAVRADQDLRVVLGDRGVGQADRVPRGAAEHQRF